MVKHRCKICAREFSSAHGLTQHCNARHHGTTTSENTRERTRRQPSQAPPPGARAISNLPRQSESATIHRLAPLRSLLACFFRSCQRPAHFKKRVHRSPVPGRGNDGKFLLNSRVGEFRSAVPIGAVKIDFAVQNAKPFTTSRQRF